MTNPPHGQVQSAGSTTRLRERAEEALRTSHAESDGVQCADIQKLVHDLQVHQIELQMQNEELRAAQIELAESRDRFSDLYEFAPVGYLTLDKEGQILEANLTAAWLLGVERQSLQGEKLASFVAPVSQNEYYRHRRTVFVSDTKHVCELEMRPARRSPLSVRLESIAFDSKRESRRECRSALIDVTERQQAEQELHDQEDLARSILNSLTAHIAVLDRDGRIVRVNHAWEKFARDNGETEFSRTGVGVNYLDVCERAAHDGDEYAARSLEGLRAVLNRRQAEFTLEYPCHSHREQRWFLLSAAPILGDRGGAVISHLAITDRKLAEAAAKDGEERIKTILDAASDAIITIDECGNITAANPATERMFGYTQAELIGKNVSLLMPALDRNEYDEYLRRYAETGKARLIGIGREASGLRKDGSIFPVDLAVSQAQHLRLFVGVIRDISERKELQWHVLESAAEEQRRIGRELHDGLQQELIGLTLIAGTLYDALTSLLQGESEDRAVHRLDEPLSEKLRNIAASLCRKLSQASQHVRDLSHGIMPVQVDAEGLRSALEGLAAATDGLMGMICSFHCTSPVTVANNTTATHLYRIAQEAVSNALRHSQAYHIQISLLQENGQIILEVRDNGVGMVLPDAREGHEGGMGMRTMEYRAGMIGGSLRIEHVPEGGILVRCTVAVGIAND